MTNEQFLQQFGHFVEAPNGVQKLRELVLQLAVQGKLVSQDPADQTAKVLLEQTQVAKSKLIKNKIIRKTKAPLLPSESPNHELPDSWVWTSLYEIGEIGPRNQAADEIESSFIPMQLISDNYGTPIQHEKRPWKEIKSGFTHFKEEDVVLAKITPCFQNGKSAVMRGLTNGFGAGTTELHVYRSINSCTVPDYVLIYLKSPGFILDGIPKMTGTAGQKRITRDYFAGNHFPLPPLAEQHRIVAKVDELMALCDQLEAERTTRAATHQRLIRAVHHTLTEAADTRAHAADPLAAWRRIQTHFADLYTTPESVQALRQTILQLAVQGMLAEQDSRDEPTDVLFERINAAREAQINNGELKKTKALSPIETNEIPYQIPDTWAWSRMQNVFDVRDGTHDTPKYIDGTGYPLITSKNFREGEIIFDGANLISENDHREICKRSKVDKDDILFSMIGGNIGNQVIVTTDKEFSIKNVALFKYYDKQLTLPHYLKKFLEHLAIDLQKKAAGGAQPFVSLGFLRKLLIPIPPVSEQHRIVAKVDELMTLCDRLEANIRDRDASASSYAEAIVQQIAAA